MTIIETQNPQAPALKKDKFKVDKKITVSKLERFLRKQLRNEEPLFLYCGSGFSPTPDQTLEDLYDNFQVGDSLVVYYGFQEQWGW